LRSQIETPERRSLSATDRVEFAPAWARVAFAFGLGAVLAAVFPAPNEVARGADRARPDAYSLAYLHVLVRADPRDADLRLLYARQLRTLGRLEEALATLDEGHLATAEAQTLTLDLVLERARAQPEGTEARTAAFRAVERQLARVPVADVPVERLEPMADLALQLEEPALAATFYERAADLRCDRRGPLLALAARWRRAAGDEGGAAHAYALAASAEPDPHRAEEYAFLALASLEGADRVCAAADLAVQYAAQWVADRALLSRATDLALACGRPYQARDLGRRVMALGPRDLGLVERQVRLELGVGDVTAALPLVRTLVRARPEDVALRTLEARVAEWSNHPDLALSDWLALLDRPRRGPEAPDFRADVR
jgi:hypothetical protein